MIKASVIDKNYGSVSAEKLCWLQQEYALRGIELRLHHLKHHNDIIDVCKEDEIILVTGNVPLTKAILTKLPALKMVQRFGVGVNSIDLAAASEQGILISYMPGFCANELAVHACALILNIIRNIGIYDRDIRRGNWPKAQGRNPPNPSNLTLGLFGFGTSAKELCKIFSHGFGTRVLVHDPFFVNDGSWGVTQVNFNELLELSDVVSIHAPLIPETYKIFDAHAFKKMKSTSIIINVSRGEHINEDDLANALESGEIFGAGLDVFSQEPLSLESKLTRLENVVLTPHSAFHGEDAISSQLSLAVYLVNSYVNEKYFPCRYIANKDVIINLKDIVIKE